MVSVRSAGQAAVRQVGSSELRPEMPCREEMPLQHGGVMNVEWVMSVELHSHVHTVSFQQTAMHGASDEPCNALWGL